MSDFSLFTFFMHLSWLHSYTARLLQRDRSKIAKTEFTGSYIIGPLFGHFHLHLSPQWPFLQNSHLASTFRNSHLDLQRKLFLFFVSPTLTRMMNTVQMMTKIVMIMMTTYFAHLDRPADDLSQLDDNDRDGDGGEEEEDQLEEQQVRWSDCHEGIEDEGPLVCRRY